MRDASNLNVSYVDHTNSGSSLGGFDGSACGSSLGTIIRDRIIEYQIENHLQFAERFQEDQVMPKDPDTEG